MNFAYAVIIFLIFLAGIITLQVFYFKKDNKLFLVGSAVLGAGGGFTGLLLSTYYSTALDRLNEEALFMGMEAMDKIPKYENYTLICLFATIVFFISIGLSAAMIIIKKILDDKGLLELNTDIN